MTAIPLDKIRIIRGVWPRHFLDEERVALFESLLRSGEQLDPIEVVLSADGMYIDADGVHRCCAFRRAGLTEIEAVVIVPEEGESAESCAFRRALETATRSSLPLTMAERHTAALRLIETQPEISHRAVARLVGVAHSSVDRWAEEMAESAGPPDNDSPTVRLPTADEAAHRLVGFLAKLDQSRGLLDYLASSRMGHHLAEAFERRMGDEALNQARKVAKWVAGAVQVLEERA